VKYENGSSHNRYVRAYRERTMMQSAEDERQVIALINRYATALDTADHDAHEYEFRNL